MKTVAIAFLSGMLFAIGLAIGGMTQPAKVVGFLDVAGDWDPSLLMVMLGAVATYAPLHWLSLRRAHPVFEGAFAVPAEGAIDVPLAAGAAVFGLGWGLAGYCPGPAIAAVGALSSPAMVFAGSMLAGMWLYRIYYTLWQQPRRMRDSARPTFG